MRIVVDSSTLISLAWAGQLELLRHVPIAVVVPAEVHQEAVTEGLAKGYPDAAAIEEAVKELPELDPRAAEGTTEMHSVDHAVLEAARENGALACNDLALGRRAENLGVQWLRTADLIMLCVRAGRVSAGRGETALRALRSAGRITETLLHAYLEEVP